MGICEAAEIRHFPGKGPPHTEVAVAVSLAVVSWAGEDVVGDEAAEATVLSCALNAMGKAWLPS